MTNLQGKLCVKCGSTLRYVKSRRCVVCSKQYTYEHKAVMKEYNASPEQKAVRKEYRENPEHKAARKEYETQPQYKAAKKEYEARPKSKRQRKAAWRLRKYKLTHEGYRYLMFAQGGLCGVCNEVLIEDAVGWWDTICVDHDHITLLNRGLIHRRCNILLGLAKDSPEMLKSAATYIEVHQLVVAAIVRRPGTQ